MPCSAERKTKLLQKITAKGARTTHKELQHLLPNMVFTKSKNKLTWNGKQSSNKLFHCTYRNHQHLTQHSGHVVLADEL